MNKILSLSKVLFLEQFKSFFAKVSSRKKARGIVFAVLISALILFSIGSTYYSQYLMLEINQMQKFILFYAIINVVFILLILFTLQIQNVFFDAKDYELLASLPLKNYEIIVSKLIAQLINAYIFSFFILAPSLYFFFISSYVGVLSVIYLILGFLFLPFFNFFVATMVAFVVNWIAKFFKNPKRAKNIFSYIFMFALIVGALIINFTVVNELGQIGKVPRVLDFLFPTATQYFYAVGNASFPNFLIYIALNIVFMAVVVFLLSKTYFKVNKFKKTPKNKVDKEVSFGKQSIFKNLTKFEFKKFLSIPIYVFNAALGTVLSFLAVIAVPFVYFFLIKGSAYEVMLLQKDFMLTIGFMLALSTGLNCTTYASVSIEGVMYSFKKSLPISFEKNMLAKVMVNMLLAIPTLLLLIVLLPFFIGAGLYFYEILLLFTIAFSTQLFISLIGLFSNLMFIKLNWTNPTVLVKQSAPAFIFAMMILVLIFGTTLLMPVALKVMSIQIFMFLIFITLNLLTILFWLLIKTIGKKKYNKAG